jgi:molybdenum cofactor cytidylyltransferase
LSIRGLLLCGGASVRFGRNKLLERVGVHSEPMAVACARPLVGAVQRVLAVTRTGEREVRALLERAGCEVLETDRSRDGLGASLAAGIDATADASGWIVTLADMPFIRQETVAAVRAALEAGAVIAAPAYEGVRGHPVGFGAQLRAELAALAGDAGARSLIEAHPELLRFVPVEDPGILRDIDRPEDLTARSRDSHGRK